MQVDFYRVDRARLARVLGTIAGRVLADGNRLLVVADGDQAVALDGELWEISADSFLPHGRASGDDPGADQPVLIAGDCDAPANGARHVALADGRWREAALGFDRAFHLFDEAAVEPARAAWRALAGAGGVTRNFWSQDDAGRWTKVA